MKQDRGEITVFLSLILVLVLALISTVIESARVSVIRVYAERALQTSMDSVLAQYDKNLYKRYHILGFSGIGGINQNEEEAICKEIKEYMEYTFTPNKDLMIPGTSIPQKNVDLYKLAVKQMTIEDFVRLTDYNGEIFVNQAVAFMKYKTVADLLEGVLEKMNLLDSSAVMSEATEKKLQAEQSLSKIDELTMELMKYVEGVSINDGSLEPITSNLVRTEEFFVKRLCPVTVNMDSLQIGHTVIFNSLKKSYLNPVKLLLKVKINLEEYFEKGEEKRSLESMKQTLLNTFEENMKEEERKKLQQQVKAIIKEIKEVSKCQKEYLEITKKTLSAVENLCRKSREKIKSSLNLLSEIKESKKEAILEINSFEQYLKSAKEDLNTDTYTQMSDELKLMKQYTDAEGSSCPLFQSDKMKKALEDNMQVLEQALKFFPLKVSENEEDLKKVKDTSQVLSLKLQLYNIKDLAFDYSNLVIKENVKSPLKIFKKFISDGFLSLIIDDIEKISKKSIEKGKLPSERNQDKKEVKEADFAEILENSKEKEYNQELGSGIKAYQNICPQIKESENKGEQTIKKLLFDSYIIEHFQNWTMTQKEKENSDNRVLDYEQEYIIGGKNSDDKNLKAVISKILFFRTVLNFIYLLGASDAVALARTTAAELVGFTGFLPLISLVKTMILAVWAFEEALIDSRALMDNKAVPLFKNKKIFKLQYHELLSINKQVIQKKAAQYSEEGKGFLYSDYIRLFLFIAGEKEKSYYAMDLIQENIKSEKNNNFSMNQCIYGYRIKASFESDTRFLQLPFVNKYLAENQKSHSYDVIRETSY